MNNIQRRFGTYLVVFVSLGLAITLFNFEFFTVPKIYSTLDGTNNLAVDGIRKNVPDGINPPSVSEQKDSKRQNITKNLVAETQELIVKLRDERPLFPDTPLGHHLKTHIEEVVESVGPDANSRYQESMDVLRASPEDATIYLEEAYQILDEPHYYDRWKIVNTLASLENEVALGALVNIAQEPVPEKVNRGPTHFSTREEELMIRTAAIDGIKSLAGTGLIEARDELAILVTSEDHTVRLAAVIAYRRLPLSQEDVTEEVQALLPPEDEWMLKIRLLGAPVNSPYKQNGDERSTKVRITGNSRRQRPGNIPPVARPDPDDHI